jgi:hypothetical protein
MNLLDAGQPWILVGEQSGLQTHTAATGSASLRTRMKSVSGTRISDPRSGDWLRRLITLASAHM